MRCYSTIPLDNILPEMNLFFHPDWGDIQEVDGDGRGDVHRRRQLWSQLSRRSRCQGDPIFDMRLIDDSRLCDP